MENRDERNDIPSITIIMDVPPAPPDPRMEPSLSPTPCFLSPSSKSYCRPSPDFSGTSTANPPPSPTLSNYSTHFPTTLRLRDNKPEDISRFSSLGVLESHVREEHPNDAERECKIDGEKDRMKKKGKDDDDDDDHTAHQLELSQDQAIDPCPFRFQPFQLAHMLDPKNFKNFDALQSFGGIDGLLRGLGTDSEHGLSSTEADDGATMEDRRRVFGENVLPTRTSRTLLQLLWAAFQDKILLSIAAVVSLALGLFQDFGTNRKPGEPPVDWVEGVAIMITIAIVVLVGSVNDWQKEQQSKRLELLLNERKEVRVVKVIRDGVEKVIDKKEVVVGDIALAEPGEILPCDGILISGHNVKCDESGATGESEPIKKASYNDVLELQRKIRVAGKDPYSGYMDCFMVSGCKVVEGVGKYVVVAVGTKSFHGRMMMALREDTENPPLQLKSNNFVKLIAQLGSVAGAVLFTALMIKFLVQLGQGIAHWNANFENGINLSNILIFVVTVVIVDAVMEGLLLAVTRGISTKRLRNKNLVRDHDAVRKFLQFQIYTNVIAVVITFVSAVASVQETSVLSAIPLLWINIIMNTFAALLFVMDPAKEQLLECKPAKLKKTAPPFSVDMYKAIIMQSIYQIVILLVLHFRGVGILGFEHTMRNEEIVKILVFSIFAFAEIFSFVICRRLGRKLDIFEDISKTRSFFVDVTVLGLMLFKLVNNLILYEVVRPPFLQENVVHIWIMLVGWGAFQVTRIRRWEWGPSLAHGVLSWDIVINFIPGKPVQRAFEFLRKLTNILRGRLGSAPIRIKSRNAHLSPCEQVGGLSSRTTAGSVYSDARLIKKEDSAAFWGGKPQMYSDVPPDDPMPKQFSEHSTSFQIILFNLNTMMKY